MRSPGHEILRPAVGGGEAGLELRLVEELGRAAPRARRRAAATSGETSRTTVTSGRRAKRLQLADPRHGLSAGSRSPSVIDW